MRIRALTCGLLQHSKIWTQNPSKATSWGLNSPSRHQYNVSKCNNLHGSSCAVPLCSFLPLGGLVHVGCDDSCDILQSSDSVVVIAIRSPKHRTHQCDSAESAGGFVKRSRPIVLELASTSPMRGDVKERFSLRPLREEMDVAICIQPGLRCGEALYSRRASHRPRQSTVSVRRFHNSMVRRLRSRSYASNPGWL
jgi:hypothetical protein